MADPANLTNQFLIAMPGLADPNFHQTVTLICDHNDEGAMGIVSNRPLNLQLAEIFSQLSLGADASALGAHSILQGGPVQQERGFVLHDGARRWELSMRVSAELSLTRSRDILQAMAHGDGPGRAVVALGYAGWSPGQLEQELSDNAWLSVPAVDEIIFDTPFEERWEAAARLLGVDLSLLSSEPGHA